MNLRVGDIVERHMIDNDVVHMTYMYIAKYLLHTYIHTFIHTYIQVLPGTKICYLIASDLAFQPVQP
jgi:hypothetical protein